MNTNASRKRWWTRPTAARTVAELDAEIAILDNLVELATRPRQRQRPQVVELRSLLIDRSLLRDDDGNPRELIIFSEHHDTLDYLTRQVRNVIGSTTPCSPSTAAPAAPTGGRPRTVHPGAAPAGALIATDAAGEGLNLQAAHR